MKFPRDKESSNACLQWHCLLAAYYNHNELLSKRYSQQQTLQEPVTHPGLREEDCF
jgi:hypothetical protein